MSSNILFTCCECHEPVFDKYPEEGHRHCISTGLDGEGYQTRDDWLGFCWIYTEEMAEKETAELDKAEMDKADQEAAEAVAQPEPICHTKNSRGEYSWFAKVPGAESEEAVTPPPTHIPGLVRTSSSGLTAEASEDASAATTLVPASSSLEAAALAYAEEVLGGPLPPGAPLPLLRRTDALDPLTFTESLAAAAPETFGAQVAPMRAFAEGKMTYAEMRALCG